MTSLERCGNSCCIDSNCSQSNCGMRIWTVKMVISMSNVSISWATWCCPTSRALARKCSQWSPPTATAAPANQLCQLKRQLPNHCQPSQLNERMTIYLWKNSHATVVTLLSRASDILNDMPFSTPAKSHIFARWVDSFLSSFESSFFFISVDRLEYLRTIPDFKLPIQLLTNAN